MQTRVECDPKACAPNLFSLPPAFYMTWALSVEALFPFWGWKTDLSRDRRHRPWGQTAWLRTPALPLTVEHGQVP